jgi:hypothetical protein
MLAGVFGVPVSALVVESVVWNRKFVGMLVAGVIVQAEASVGPALMTVTKVVAGTPI